ncbi:MAG TPA: pyruvate:ferredoxin (flavodoxin) oxidoreductase [Tepidisphaeraceae bacterium]|nr:pyruvate:ferredoxin (flavodoxin) oxidoreductase [Tepidisphaeraceae bacterium]
MTARNQPQQRKMVTLDANEAAASVAHRLSEVICIYPITPSSPMGEFSDEWSAKGMTNIWGTVPQVTEMQSEAGAAGAVHGALQAGALSTTFTASQGLLLMIPNMYKIAGELTPFAMHVTARTLATHALSIFGDHSDVYACRQTGFAMLCSNSVQEAHDLALVAHAATLESRVPFLHFFDGFRTSHEVSKIEQLNDDDLRALVDDQLVAAHRGRALSPDHPVIRGTAQNPDAFFQAREACNKFYQVCPTIVHETMRKFAALTGRSYDLFDYYGDPNADRVIVAMGSGCETIEQTIDYLRGRGEKLGLIKVRLYRPFPVNAFVAALPKTTVRLAVLDRTKEPGAVGDPLYLDVVTALLEAQFGGFLPMHSMPRIVAGRYGLSSKEFTPAMVAGIFDELNKTEPKNHFTVGIVDDVTHTSLPWDDQLDIEAADVTRAVFYGLGADGTVGANKNSIKIIGEETDNWAQGYFVYDSKKSGAMTTSHLRFGPRPIKAPYLIKRAGFVAVHQWKFLEKMDVLELAGDSAVVLLNAPFGPGAVWDQLPIEIQQPIIDRKLKLFVIDAFKVARDTGMGVRINTIMQTCFFALSGVLPREEAIAQIKKSIKKTYGRKGDEVVQKNFAAVDHTLAHLYEVKVPATASSTFHQESIVSGDAPDFVKRVEGMMLANKGDLLPVSAFPVDGSWPLGTARYEKRNIAMDIPVWESGICIQCNKCVMACPHAAIRAKFYDPAALGGAPDSFKAVDFKSPDQRGKKYTLQVAPEDCTGCTVCVAVCPAKNKSNPREKAINMRPQMPIRDAERSNYDFFLNIPEADRRTIKLDVKGSQFLQPLFEYSGACSGCGETPYVKLMTQLFGDRAVIGNATGCSSIYGGNLPTTPYCTNHDGRGPAWANSLFEDNAEFGMGMRLALDKHSEQAKELLQKISSAIGDTLVTEILTANQSDETGIASQRQRIVALREKLARVPSALLPQAKRLEALADYLVKKSVWIVGGDGWAYDIGFGGLDHVLASGRNVNILVLDTEVYSNTGGQQSKATPIGAAAKFASAGKTSGKKDLGLIAMSYGNAYVARVAFGAKDVQTVKAFTEADSYDGPSIIIAYSHCIAHGYDLANGPEQQKIAVETGYWPLYRFDPRRVAAGEAAMQLDSNPPKGHPTQFTKNETRFRMVEQQNAERFQAMMETAKRDIDARYALYAQLATVKPANGENGIGH